MGNVDTPAKKQFKDKKKKNKKKKKKNHQEPRGEVDKEQPEGLLGNAPVVLQANSLNSGKKKRRTNDKSSTKKVKKTKVAAESPDSKKGLNVTSQAKTNEKIVYVHGNYPGYYKYRGNPASDPRIAALNKEWFQGVDCLDIGCNTGEATLRIAEVCLPRHIFGIDIDDKLIKKAQKNLAISIVMRTSRSRSFLLPKKQGWEGRNISFRTEDFVNSDFKHPEYGVILCFSVTKWIHLNGGDDALVKFFHKCYGLLKPGGRFIVEPQQWHSYQSKYRVSEITKANYSTIKLRPEAFPELLTSKIGFKSCEVCLEEAGEKGKSFEKGNFTNSAPGFKRPMYLLIK